MINGCSENPSPMQLSDKKNQISTALYLDTMSNPGNGQESPYFHQHELRQRTKNKNILASHLNSWPNINIQNETSFTKKFTCRTVPKISNFWVNARSTRWQIKLDLLKIDFLFSKERSWGNFQHLTLNNNPDIHLSKSQTLKRILTFLCRDSASLCWACRQVETNLAIWSAHAFSTDLVHLRVGATTDKPAPPCTEKCHPERKIS